MARAAFHKKMASFISFTPDFSQVLLRHQETGNRLNGFPRNLAQASTWLKPGENEIRNYNASRRLFRFRWTLPKYVHNHPLAVVLCQVHIINAPHCNQLDASRLIKQI